ncbi:MAG: synthase subunit gamma [Bacteroidota bacterium]|jgi:F-type H+-transporting ATPase subunit gamma|nr:ATP synthase F1 subunit gamma [Bacteroidota bacterium]NBW42861.1 ATP synthase F1 subunit gamma [Sphingobacteriia bacterium]
MANLKEVRVRIASVVSTQQITKAMKMVSASKLRRAQGAIQQIRPYAEGLQNMVGRLVSGLDGSTAEMPLTTVRDVKRVGIVLLTSDKGLCGGFNSNLIKTARRFIQDLPADQQATLIPVGRKGVDFFKRSGLPQDLRFKDLMLKIRYQATAEMAAELSKAFIQGEYDQVVVVYSEFKNPVVQYFRVMPWLPLQAEPSSASSAGAGPGVADYLYEPGREEIVRDLLPFSLAIDLHKAMLDTQASEHGARMTAMDKATENAGDLLRELRLQYNRARQAAITTEITEIVGGAAALAG